MLGAGILASAFFMAVPVYAEVETETAGSSLKEERVLEENIEFYSGERGKLTGEWKENEQGKWYEYSDGTYPQTSWRKIDGKWYYFNSKGYWIDDNTYEEGTLKGIDVSAWQEKVDWQAVKNDGFEFSMIRLGYNTNQLDKYYQRNMKEAEKVQIPVGVYYYSKAVNEAEAVRDAEFVIENLKGYKVSYPVAIDLEDKVQENLSKEELGKIARAFADEVASAGYTPMVYANENWYLNYIDWSLLGDVEKWIARYNAVINPNIERQIWQCCDTGRIDGVKGNVDINFGYKDYTKYITPRTEPLESYYKKGLWQKNDKGWWYQYKNGQYPMKQWEYINEQWYWFDEEGYMQTGWQLIDGNWYYMNESGAMTTGWQFLGENWYYLGTENDGVMKKGWEYINGAYYNLGEDGAMLTGWQFLGENWYYLGTENDGVMKKGWEYINGAYYNLGEDGAMLTGWQSLGGYWYYLGTEKDGAMKKGWELIDGKYYNLGEDGIMLTGLQVMGDDIYMLKNNGAMVANQNYNFNGGNLPIGKDGKVEGETAVVIKKAYENLNEIGWDLRTAFDWSSDITYYGIHKLGVGPKENDIHSVWYADYGFDNHKGNCYVMASTFCYMARLLGYESYFIEGEVILKSGKLGIHGWCEIVIDGTTYVYDPNFINMTGRDGFQIYYGKPGTWRYVNYKRVE